MSEGQAIGEIVLLQIHGDLLVPGDAFDPSPLIQVEALSIDQAGVVGWRGDSWALDVHHRSWPGRGGRRPVSIGFTSHYDKMRERFRDIPLEPPARTSSYKPTTRSRSAISVRAL